MRYEETFSNLLKFGMTEGEAKVYLTLLKGSSTKSEIVKDSGISSSIAYEILEKLIKKGLASYAVVENKKKFYASNPEKLFDLIEDERKRIENLNKDANRMMPFLKQITKEKVLFANTYKNSDGLKAMLKEIEDEVKRGEIKEWLAMGVTSHKNESFNSLWLKWHKNFRARHNVKARFLFCEKGSKYYNDLKKTSLNEVRYLTSIPLSCITVAGDSSLIMKYANYPYFLHIKDADVANTIREIFNFLWDIAKE
jgi:predicted transcriptional regulator